MLQLMGIPDVFHHFSDLWVVINTWHVCSWHHHNGAITSHRSCVSCHGEKVEKKPGLITGVYVGKGLLKNTKKLLTSSLYFLSSFVTGAWHLVDNWVILSGFSVVFHNIYSTPVVFSPLGNVMDEMHTTDYIYMHTHVHMFTCAHPAGVTMAAAPGAVLDCTVCFDPAYQ